MLPFFVAGFLTFLVLIPFWFVPFSIIFVPIICTGAGIAATIHYKGKADRREMQASTLDNEGGLEEEPWPQDKDIVQMMCVLFVALVIWGVIVNVIM